MLIGRRALLQAMGVGGMFATPGMYPAWARSLSAGVAPVLPTLSGEDITLTIAPATIAVGGRRQPTFGINGTVPGPLLRLREGQLARIRVVNHLHQDTSLHWHGLLVPAAMDGVPGVSFPGIAAGQSFLYDFPVRQSGTYWYHSHSGGQEQQGLYGPIVIDPAGLDPVVSDREHVIVLSDHSPLSPHEILRRLKIDAGQFNYRRQTLADLLAGRGPSPGERLRWGGMRMDRADVSDVGGATYTYLVNGHGPGDNWTALFRPGERVRLRVINASAMTIFNLRIPGLSLQVVQADGQNLRPITVEEIQIGVAETYDVIITPAEDRAYALVAEAVDRSGMACATLAPRAGMVAAMPLLRRAVRVTMKDMGMGSMSGDAHMDRGTMGMRDFANAPQIHRSPGVQTIAPMPVDRTGEPGQGLSDVGHTVLTYRDLIALDRNPDTRAPSRYIEVHLTGNMERYMWSFDGRTMAQAHEPIPLQLGERLRVTLINDTMMAHPIHLHGHFFELVTGHGDYAPRKHTVVVAPGGIVTLDVTASAPGDWAFHCHLLYHMAAGMMRIVSVREGQSS